MADLAVAGGTLDAGVTALLERYFELRLEDEPQLFGALEMVELAGGDWLFHQGDPGDSLYFLARGRLEGLARSA